MSTENAEFDDGIFEIIGTGSAVMQAIVFTAVGYIALESIAFGVIVGLFAGVGSFLFLPWFLGLTALQEQEGEDIPFSEIVRQADGNPQIGILGLGLEMGSVVMLATGFGLEEVNLILGIGAAIGTTLVVYLIGSILLDLK